LTDFAFPIRLDTRNLGVLFCGQIRIEDDDGAGEEAVKHFALTIGENSQTLLNEYLKMPVQRKADLRPLVAKLQEVAGYFCRLAREKSIYATEISTSVVRMPGGEASYA
jgi:ligand-binding sensor protein